MIGILDKEKMKAAFNNYDVNEVEKIIFVTGSEFMEDVGIDISTDNSMSKIYVHSTMIGDYIFIRTWADTILLPEDMSYAFSNMKSLKEIDFGRAHIDASNVVTMDHFCSNDEQLEKIDLSSMYFDSLKDSSYAFSCCKRLEDVKLGRDFRNLENCRSMFEQCNTLKQLDLSMLFYQNKVKNSSFIANRCENLESAKIGTGNLSIGMFNQCPNLKELDIDVPTKEIHNLIKNNVLYSLSPLAQGLLTAEKYRRQNLSVMEDLEERIDDMKHRLANRCGGSYEEFIVNLPEDFMNKEPSLDLNVESRDFFEKYVDNHIWGENWTDPVYDCNGYFIYDRCRVVTDRITSSLMDRIEDIKSIMSLIALKDMADEIDIEKIDLDEYFSKMKKLNEAAEQEALRDYTKFFSVNEIKDNALECVNDMYLHAIEAELD